MGQLLLSSIVLNLWSVLGIHGRVPSEPTQRPHLADYDRPPRTKDIVEPPDFSHMAKRQETDMRTGAFTITIAPDATCGFISGSPYNPVTCRRRDYHCAWGSELGVVICGFLEDKSFSAGIHMSCVEREKALNASLCNDACQSNLFNLLCTNKSAPYCLTYAYPKGIEEYRCARTSVVHSVSFTTDTKRAAQFITATVPLKPSTATETAYTLKATDTEPVTTTMPETSMTIPPPPLPSSKPDSNLGAIIGGAVGGFAALLLIALILVWFVRRLKRDDAPGKAGPTKTHEMSGEPAHYEMSGEPAHYEMSGEPAHYEMSGEPAHS